MLLVSSPVFPHTRVHLSLLHLIHPVIFWEEHRTWSTLLRLISWICR